MNNNKNLFISKIKEYLNSLNAYYVLVEDDNNYETNLLYVQKQKCITYYKFKLTYNNNLYVLFNHKDIRYNNLYDIYNEYYKK